MSGPFRQNGPEKKGGGRAWVTHQGIASIDKTSAIPTFLSSDSRSEPGDTLNPSIRACLFVFDFKSAPARDSFSHPSGSRINLNLSYDADNRLTSMVDGIGTTAYSYDQMGRLLSAGGLWPHDTVDYTYQNGLRMQLSLAHPNGPSWMEDYGYDDARRLIGVESSAGEFDYTYDPVKLQRVDSLGLPNGACITNTFDSVARILSTALLSSSGANLDSQNYVYNTAGQRTSETNATGDYRNYTYDNEGELTKALAHESNGSTRLMDEAFYDYDAAGNMALKESGFNPYRGVNYTLNNLDEITGSIMGSSLGFGWGISNAVSGSTSGKASSVTVNGTPATLFADNSFYAIPFGLTNGLNTYTAIAEDASGDLSTNTSTVNAIPTNNAYAYDSNGNLTFDGYKNFAYDDENELIAVWVTGVWSNSFAYDGKMRRRIEQDYAWQGNWVETNEVHFIYDGNVVVEERNANNVPLVSYTRGVDLDDSLQGAGGIGGLLARTTYGQEIPGAPTTSFYHADGNGNITALIYPNQQLAAKYLYGPFGNMLAMSGPLETFNKYRFSSKEWDENSGLYYYGYRFYDPGLQRWLNHDPIQERGGLNLYGFVRNNPLSWIDPLGLAIFPADFIGPIPQGSSRSPFLSVGPPPGVAWDTGTDSRGPYAQNVETGIKYYPDEEDARHWPHYDASDGSRYPEKCEKTRPGQKRPPYGDQSAKNPWPQQQPPEEQPSTPPTIRWYNPATGETTTEEMGRDGMDIDEIFGEDAIP
jgi:RHS repeat-associated protein